MLIWDSCLGEVRGMKNKSSIMSRYCCKIDEEIGIEKSSIRINHTDFFVLLKKVLQCDK